MKRAEALFGKHLDCEWNNTSWPFGLWEAYYSYLLSTTPIHCTDRMMDLLRGCVVVSSFRNNLFLLDLKMALSNLTLTEATFWAVATVTLMLCLANTMCAILHVVM